MLVRIPGPLRVSKENRILCIDISKVMTNRRLKFWCNDGIKPSGSSGIGACTPLHIKERRSPVLCTILVRSHLLDPSFFLFFSNGPLLSRKIPKAKSVVPHNLDPTCRDNDVKISCTQFQY